MPAFATLALPHMCKGNTYHWTHFDSDATVGVCHDGHFPSSGMAWVFNKRDTVNRSDWDGRMWEMAGTLKDGTSVTIGPANAGEFKSYDVGSIYGNEAHLFEWRRVAVPGAEEGDRLWVRVLMRNLPGNNQGPGNYGPKFWWWFGRERGESVTIDHMKCPVLWVKSPCPSRGGPETAFQASKRARIIMPQVSPNFNGQVGSNANFYVHASVPVTKTITGPNLQHLQFWAVVQGDYASPGYKEVLSGYTLDTAGWHKAYHYQGYHYTVDETAWAKFAPVYYPRFGKAFTRGKIENGIIPESLYGNTGGAPYAFMLFGWPSQCDTYWYDVADQYRTWYQSAVNPPLLATDPNRGNHMKTGGLWYGTIQIVNKTSYQQAQFYDRCLSIMRDWMSLLDSTEHRAASYAVWHQQSTGKDFSLHMPGPFGDGQYSDEWVRVATQSKIYGIRPSSYSMSEAWTPLTSRWNEVMTGQFLICKRNGTTDYGFQIADPAVRTALVNGYNMLAAKSGCNSFYMDLGSGSGASPSYSTPGENVGPYGIVPRHGNYEHTAAKIDMIQRIRVNTKAGDPHNIIASESCEEALGPYLDLTQDGYNILPNTGYFSEQQIYNTARYPGVPDLNFFDVYQNIRMIAPPLWQIVHNQWSPVGRFACMPVNIALSTNSVYHPDGAFTGMTDTELINLHCFVAGALFVSGVKQLFDFDTGNDFPLMQTIGGVVRSHPTYDPTDAGGTIFAFYKTLFQALTPSFAGQFLLGGKMLNQPIMYGMNAMTTPLYACRKVSPQAWRAFPYLYDAGKWATTTSYAAWDTFPSMTSMTGNYTEQVPFITLWQSRTGKFGAVVMNWSNINGDLYCGIVTYVSSFFAVNNVDVYELALDGSRTYVGTMGGSTNITFGNFSLPQVDIGVIPPRSVRVFEFQPI